MSRVYSKQAELTNKIVSGVQKLSEAVGTTLGPKGRNL